MHNTIAYHTIIARANFDSNKQLNNTINNTALDFTRVSY